jgi:hypothetical protein
MFKDFIDSPAEREAFEVNREKYREENLQRIRRELKSHQVPVRDLHTGEIKQVSTGLKVLAPRERKNVRVSIDEPRKFFSGDHETDYSFSPYGQRGLDATSNEMILSDPKLQDDIQKGEEAIQQLSYLDRVEIGLNRDVVTGPEITDLSDDTKILTEMEQFVKQKCGDSALKFPAPDSEYLPQPKDEDAPE